MLIVGCGRVSFDPASADDGGGGVRDASNATDATDATDATGAGGTTVTFGDRMDATFQGVARDTFISNEAGEALLNYGTARVLRNESDSGERALLAFDVSAVPASAAVTAAMLTLTVTEANASATLSLHPLLEAWDEGSQDGLGGVANFGNRTTADLWSSAGAGMPQSSGPAIASFDPAVLGTITFALPIATVQGWVSNPGTNHGLVFLTNSAQTSRFASSEASPSTDRPLLTVTYQP